MKFLRLFAIPIIVFFCFWIPSFAQTTAFSHQGKLDVSGAPAYGSYDFEFKLFDAVSAGTQQGSTVQQLNVTVANGVYGVSLDFGAGALTGADRFLEVSVRTAGGGAFTILTPRQKLLSAPYAVKSIDATNATNATNATTATTATNFTGTLAGDVTGPQGATSVVALRGRSVAGTTPANGQLLIFNGGLSQWEPNSTVPVGAIPAGSGNYIQNTTSPQAMSNFNISGDGHCKHLQCAPIQHLWQSRPLDIRYRQHLCRCWRRSDKSGF